MIIVITVCLVYIWTVRFYPYRPMTNAEIVTMIQRGTTIYMYRCVVYVNWSAARAALADAWDATSQL